MNALHLSALMWSRVHFREAVRYSLDLALDAAAADDANAQIDRSETHIPRRSALEHSARKLDCLTMLWEREEAQLYRYWRYLSMDASTKKLNYFCQVEARTCGVTGERLSLAFPTLRPRSSSFSGRAPFSGTALRPSCTRSAASSIAWC